MEDNLGRTPLWHAAWYVKLEAVQWLIASGRDLGDIERKEGKDCRDRKYYTALEIARTKQRTEAVLERFIANPAQTRLELRVKLGMLDELAAEVFALSVFLCDDLLPLKSVSNPATTPTLADNAAIRFFTIAAKLPMELQMILCHQTVGSTKQNILRKDSEAAFQSLAKTFLPLI